MNQLYCYIIEVVGAFLNSDALAPNRTLMIGVERAALKYGITPEVIALQRALDQWWVDSRSDKDAFATFRIRLERIKISCLLKLTPVTSGLDKPMP